MSKSSVCLVLLLSASLFAYGCGGDGKSDADVFEAPLDVVHDLGAQDDPGPAVPDTMIDPGGFPPDIQTDTGKDDLPEPDTGHTDPGHTDPDPTCPGAVVASPGTCIEIAICGLGCPGDEDFANECFEGSDSVDEQAAFTALLDCVTSAGGQVGDITQGEIPSDYAFADCHSELLDCMPTGTKTCREIWNCRKACEPDNPGCPLRCFAAGAPDDQDLWIACRKLQARNRRTGGRARADGRTVLMPWVGWAR